MAIRHSLFPRHVLVGISKLPKMSRFWLCFHIDMLSTVLLYVHICVALTVLCSRLFSDLLNATIGQLCTVPCTLLVNLLFSHSVCIKMIGKQSQNTDILGNLEIQARTCTGKRCTYGHTIHLKIKLLYWHWCVPGRIFNIHGIFHF